MFQRPVIARLRGIGARTLALVALVGGVACGRVDARADSTGAAAIQVTDDAGVSVKLAAPAQRVISLIPSATETLIALGATKQIVGRTRYDVAPEVASLPSVGGGIDPSAEAIVALHPDLVIAWANDKRQAIREKLVSLNVPVFILRTEDTTDIFRGISSIGHLTGHDSAAKAISASMRESLDSVRRSVASLPPRKMMYVEFAEPPMTIGSRTFIGQLVALAGGKSVFADLDQLWPNVSMEEVVRRDPDLLVVPVGEFRQNALQQFRLMAGWRDLRAVREGHVVSVPADLLSRPSPSIAEAARVLRSAMHPEVATK
ncbi:MAG TPA: cobalamin-binding protein [Gemmatimonadaceae bacterium]